MRMLHFDDTARFAVMRVARMSEVDVRSTLPRCVIGPCASVHAKWNGLTRGAGVARLPRGQADENSASSGALTMAHHALATVMMTDCARPVSAAHKKGA